MNPTSYQFRNGLRYLRKLAKAPGQAPDLLATTVGTKLQMAKARFLASSGLAAKLYGNYKGRGLVVMFHEIHEDVDAGLRMGCSPAQLENVLQALRSRGRDLVTVEEGLRRLGDPAANDFAIVTFDGLCCTGQIWDELTLPFGFFRPRA